MNWFFTIFLLHFFSYTVGKSTEKKSLHLLTTYRLPGTTRPLYYSIKIHPNLGDETFKGQVTIHLKTDSSVESLEFHSSQLKITGLYFDTRRVCQISVTCSNDFDFGFEYSQFELIRITRKNKLVPPGNHVVHITYHGIFSKTTEGIFKTEFTKYFQKLSDLMATDFEPTHARKVIPCFDEPGFKARYQLNVVVPNSSYVALSNMRVADKFKVSGGILYKFETTPVMPIYTLAFAVTKYEYNEYIDDYQIPYRVYSYNVTQRNTTQLLEFASKVIEFFSNYTIFNNPLPKIDFIEFDRSRSSGAENWGLVTLATDLGFSDDDGYNSRNKFVVAHELAHFWFGNLVTNAWWDDVWLQEGFATFMAAKAEDHILKNKEARDFLAAYKQILFWSEKYGSTPVVHLQENPAEIRENFNTITYFKGLVILQMAELVIGEEKMRKAIIEYVKKFAYKTATTEDFLTILESYTDDVNLRESIESYLYQSQVPIIYIEEEEEGYVLNQTSLNEIRNNTATSFRSKWTIPITYITNFNKTSTMVWFSKDMERLVLPKRNTTWIKLNYGQIGYYRVRYSDHLWQMLIQNLKELELSEKEHLIMEALHLYDWTLNSCNMIAKYFWEIKDMTSTEVVASLRFYETLNPTTHQCPEETVEQTEEKHSSKNQTY